jgi:hypothetical protein
MNATVRVLVALLLLLGLTGCGTIHPVSGGVQTGYYTVHRPDGAYRVPVDVAHYSNRHYAPAAKAYQAHHQQVYLAVRGQRGKWEVDSCATMTQYQFNTGIGLPAQRVRPAYLMPDGRWNIGGMVQINPPSIIGECAIQAPAVMGMTRTTSLVPGSVPMLGGMSPETASKLLVELEAKGNPCSAGSHTGNVTVGAIIGGIALAVLTGDVRWAAAGALVGAAGGNGNAQWSCQAYTDTRHALLAVIDQNGCAGEVRRTNGVTSDDERCQYRRNYAPTHQSPQIADQAASARPVPKAEQVQPK